MKKVVKRKNKISNSTKNNKKSKASVPKRSIKNKNTKAINKNTNRNNLVSIIKENRLLQIAIIISVLLLLAILVASMGNPTGNAITGYNTDENQVKGEKEIIIENLLDNPVSPNFNKISSSFFGTTPKDDLSLGNTYKDLIIAFLVLLILFAGLYDLLTFLSSGLSEWVHILIAAAISIISALSGVVTFIVVWAVQFAGKLATWGIIIEIIICIIIFVLLSFGNTWAAKLAIKRNGFIAAVKSAKGANAIENAILALNHVNDAFLLANDRNRNQNDRRRSQRGG